MYPPYQIVSKEEVVEFPPYFPSTLIPPNLIYTYDGYPRLCYEGFPDSAQRYAYFEFADEVFQPIKYGNTAGVLSDVMKIVRLKSPENRHPHRPQGCSGHRQ